MSRHKKQQMLKVQSTHSTGTQMKRHQSQAVPHRNRKNDDYVYSIQLIFLQYLAQSTMKFSQNAFVICKLLYCIKAIGYCKALSMILFRFIQKWQQNNDQILFILNYYQSISMHTHRMQVSTLLLFLIICLYFQSCNSSSGINFKVDRISLNSDWQLQILQPPKQASKFKLTNKIMKTELPTNLYLDLMSNNIIQDIYYRDNLQKYKWVGQCKMVYRKKFKISKQDMHRTVQLIFNGIDTYSTITLNGKHILQTANSFREYVVKLDPSILNYKKEGQQILEIAIWPASIYNKAGMPDPKNPTNQILQQDFRYSRKPMFHYPTDWSPGFVTSGISKVEIRFYYEVRIQYVWVRNKIFDMFASTISVAVQLEFNVPKQGKIDLSVYQVKAYYDNDRVVIKSVQSDTVYCNVLIELPYSWWPRGIGKPYIYDFVVELVRNKQTIDKRKIPFGLRRTQVNQQSGSVQIAINSINVYCKGANFVPMDFLPRKKGYHKQFSSLSNYTGQQLLKDAAAANFNMIRIWGGGQYVDQDFLQLASRLGIMIWYDFMFSGGFYPATSAFLENVEEEIKQQIRRARNYPAVVLWNGNDQILMKLKSQNKDVIYETQYNLFQKLIKRIVSIESPHIPFIQSSPSQGTAKFDYEKGGDLHLWGVWENQEKFEHYQKIIGTFNTQFGIQSMPAFQSIKQFTKQSDRFLNSSVMLFHERDNSKFNIFKFYMTEYLSIPQSLQRTVYLSQVLQAHAAEIAFRAQLTSKKSKGTLFWQLNDCWPAISWSSIDYYGRWKALHFMAKRTFSPISIFVLTNGDVMIVNSKLNDIKVGYRIQVVMFDGTPIFKQENSSSLVFANNNKIVYKIQKDKIMDLKSSVVIYCQVYYKNRLMMASTRYFQQLKQLNLPKSVLQVEYRNPKNKNQNETAAIKNEANNSTKNTNKTEQNISNDLPRVNLSSSNPTLILSSTSLIKSLYIYHKQQSKQLRLSDNFFDLVPGHPVTVAVLNGNQLINQDYTLAKLVQGLEFMDLREGMQGQPLQVVVIAQK